ncbi:GMC oxidoreductase [Ornithobacterium rhinotracheale]|uniref:GMC oxidoreductase n=1 Tax=Ornithobacterium rhinotracheale TaxID=28251 RepID=UPI001FF67076|nr:GMC oxidoreductase [Ornithobacterium rhinotracheale]MCK0202310.1 GMC oxidoreductase [Ornithobacterium rhinotracheale]
MERRKFLELTGLGASALLASSTLSACRVLNLAPNRTKKVGHFPNIIVGSGYGGAVCARRLTENKQPVLILEMGKRWDRTPKHDTFCKMIKADKRSSWFSNWPNAPVPIPIPIKKYPGVLDKIKYDEMDIFAGRAYGGGSIVNGGISIPPRRDYFKEIFPQIDDKEMYDVFFPLANKELKVQRIPEKFYDTTEYYNFSRSAEKQAHNAGLKTQFFSNTYDFDYMQLEAKGEVYKSALGGEVIYGNNAGKFSLDQTYLKKAEETGLVSLRTMRMLDKIIANEDGTYTLEVKVIKENGDVDALEIYTCDKLFLNAGSTGTSEVLLKSKYLGGLPNLNEELGQHWGPNGNIMTGRNFVNSTGVNQSTIPVKGIDMWNGDFEYKIFAEIAPLPLGIETWTTLFLSISDNRERGNYYFDKASKKVKLNWKRSQNEYSVKAAKLLLKKLKEDNGGTRSRLLFNNGFGDDFCYHPLGGCVLGKATDDFGRVHGYKNLYVQDSSLIPGSAGVNPFVFITALAERNMATIVKEDFKQF